MTRVPPTRRVHRAELRGDASPPQVAPAGHRGRRHRRRGGPDAGCSHKRSATSRHASHRSTFSRSTAEVAAPHPHNRDHGPGTTPGPCRCRGAGRGGSGGRRARPPPAAPGARLVAARRAHDHRADAGEGDEQDAEQHERAAVGVRGAVAVRPRVGADALGGGATVVERADAARSRRWAVRCSARRRWRHRREGAASPRRGLRHGAGTSRVCTTASGERQRGARASGEGLRRTPLSSRAARPVDHIRRT